MIQHMSKFNRLSFAGGLFSTLIIFASPAWSQTINLKPGLWTSHQTTTIQGLPVGALGLTNEECIQPENASQSLEYYVQKLLQGLGHDSQCELSNLSTPPGLAKFDLACTSEANIKTEMDVEYHYSLQSVDVKAEGFIIAGPPKTPVTVTAHSEWKAPC